MIETMMGRVNADAALLRRGRYVTLAFVLGIGADDYVIDIDAGRIVAVARRRLATESGRFAIRAEGEVWREFWRPIPAPLHHDLFALLSAGLARIDGDLLPLMQNLQYFKDLLAAPRPAPDPGGVAPAPEATGPVAGAEAEFEPIIGRYFTMEVAGEAVRVYVEEAGRGIPLLCLHTAGADGRQFRHLMCDPAITDHYRVIAFDMPWHGKSNPPVGWEDRVYQLTTARYQETVLAFCRALALEKPVIMGCSMGGRVVLHLALAAPGDFRAVIALEGADRLEAYYDTDWLHRPDVHGGEVCAAFVTGQVAPQSPVEARMETLWMYAQSGPGVFKGDLHFYWVDGHFDDRSHRIDTARCPVYLLSGAYDTSCTPARARATAANIKGCRAVVMDGIGHFPMSENPPLFRTHLLPILDELRNR